MITGQVSTISETLVQFRINRVEPLSDLSLLPDTVCRYVYDISWMQPNGQVRQMIGGIGHRYGDPIVVLIGKVMDIAIAESSKSPVPSAPAEPKA